MSDKEERHKEDYTMSTAAGSLVMASAVLVLGAMKQMGLVQPVSSAIWVALIMLLWAAVMGAYAGDLLGGRLGAAHTASRTASFGIGTWTAATSQAAVVTATLQPSWKAAASVLAVAGFALLAWYLAIAVRNFNHVMHAGAGGQVNGSVLLPSVALHAAAMAGTAAFGPDFGAGPALWLWSAGLAFYAAGLYVLLMKLARTSSRQLPAGWSAANCIVHGAASIAGVTAVATKAVSPAFIGAVWLWAAVWLVAIEGFELARLAGRIRAKGWSGALLVYDSTQWSRNFTLGMFLLFSMRVRADEGIFAHAGVREVHQLAVAVLPGVVAVLFIAEWIVMLTGRRQKAGG